MSLFKKSIPGGTMILGALLVGPIVWIFATQDSGDDKRIKAKAAFNAQVPREGRLGQWYDDLGSKSYADSTITIRSTGGRYSALRESGDGSRSELKLSKEEGPGHSFRIVGERHGGRYVISPSGLEIYDQSGYIRTAKELVRNRT